MAKPSKPKTPVGEKLQVELASKMFERGSKTKDSVRTDFMASHQRDTRGQATARMGADSAISSRARIAKNRKAGKTKTVNSAIDVTSAGISQSGKGGRSYGAEGEIVRRDTSATERVASSMAKVGQQKSMQEFQRKNEKTQAALDVGMSVLSAAVYGKEASDAEEAKKNREWADKVRKETKVDPMSSMSALNYDSMGMGA